MGTRVVMLLSGTSVYFDLFSVELTTVDVSSFPFIFATALTGRQIIILNMPGAACLFIKKNKKHTECGLVLFKRVS